MQCPVCSVEIAPGNRFCEECGAEITLAALAPAAVAKCTCGAAGTDVDEDGFCLRCGRKARVALSSDRVEQVISAACAGVSDRGLRHDRNEDRFGLAAEGTGYALVVCDGVSATRSSEIASEAVTAGVLESLTAALRGGNPRDPQGVMRSAILAGSSRLAAKMNLNTRRTSARASRRLARAAAGTDDQAPSTTVVAALVSGGQLTVAWVGDSRAYWIDAEGARQLTEDHSWQNDVVQAGAMTAEEAAKSPKAHAITRWIGADAPEDGTADVSTLPIAGAGTLLLCTDGLWNYAPAAQAMAELAGRATSDGRDAVAAARELVQFALDRGGIDNVTVAMLQWPVGEPVTVV